MSFDYHKAMAEGHEYNKYIGEMLRSYGVPNVDVPEFTIATTHDQIADKTKNEKDIMVDGLVIEVKSQSLTFTNADDFPYALVIVDTVYGFDQKIIKPFAYVFVSQTSNLASNLLPLMLYVSTQFIAAILAALAFKKLNVVEKIDKK